MRASPPSREKIEDWCSSDARSEGQSGCSLYGKVEKIGRPSPGLMARLGVTVGGRVRTLRAVEDQSAPIPEEITSKQERLAFA